MKTSNKVILFATQGPSGNDEKRIVHLMAFSNPKIFEFNRRGLHEKISSFFELIRIVRKERVDFLVMEGSGVFGGLALLVCKLLWRTRFVFSSGDAIGPFIRTKSHLLAPFFFLYERLLYRFCDGFIGWTPYLVGRAISFGAKAAVTAPGWSPFLFDEVVAKKSRTLIREELGIPENALVIGIVGSLDWNSKVQYCYGKELVAAARLAKRTDIYFLVVGPGSGQKYLATMAGQLLGKRVFVTGGVPREKVPQYLYAMDLASLPQSADDLGAFRFSTKLPEYMEAKLPIVTGPLPLAYDVADEWSYKIAQRFPWTHDYAVGVAKLLDNLNLEELEKKKKRIPSCENSIFNREQQIRRLQHFFEDLSS